MQVICLEEEAFFELVERVVTRLEENRPVQEKWIKSDEAMNILGIRAKSTLQEYRNNGDIVFTQPRKRIILYDRDSLIAFNEKHKK